MRKKNKIYFILMGMIVIAAIAAVFLLLRWRGSKVLHPSEDIKSATEVVFYRQDDSKWAKDTLGDSSYTLKSSGCLVSCIASAVSMMDGNIETPKSLNEEFSRQNVYDGEGNLLWGRLNDTGTFKAQVYQEVSSQILEDDLKEGKYPIARVRMHGIGNFHYVLIVKAEDGMFYCMDPLADGLQPLSVYGNRIYAIRCVYTDSYS